MGLDILIMPLSRYLSGRFQSPLEQALGSAVERVGSAKPSNDAATVAEHVAGLKERLLREAGAEDAPWDEASEPAWTGQYHYRAYTDLRAFAAHQDHPRTKGWFSKEIVPFREEEDVSRYQGLLAVLNKGKSTSFPHLIVHADTHGYWVPLRFKAPLIVDRENYFVVGSSVLLLEELDRLGKLLGMTRDWGELSSGETAAAKDDPLGSVKYGWSVLHHAARTSVKQRMPIIFDG